MVYGRMPKAYPQSDSFSRNLTNWQLTEHLGRIAQYFEEVGRKDLERLLNEAINRLEKVDNI